MAKRTGENTYGPFLVLGSVVLVVAALYFADQVLIPLALAILFTFILAPPVSWLQRHGIKRVFAVAFVVLVSFAVVGGILWMIGQEVSSLPQEMDRNRGNITAKMKELRGDGHGIGASILKAVEDVVDKIGTLSWLPGIIPPLLETLAAVALVLMLVIFMLLRREDLRNRLLGLIGHGRVSVTTRALDEAGQRISRYLSTLLTVNASFGATLALLLFILGVPFALLWGFITGILRFVPYVGTWLSLLFPLTISVAVAETWTQPILVVICFASLELITANVIEPLLFSHSTGISQVALLVAAAFWTWLWGPIGLVMSTPLSVCLVVLGKYVPQLAFFDILLGDDPVLSPSVSYYQRLLARDQDEAIDLIEEQQKHVPKETIYDRILLPALKLARVEQERDQLSQEQQTFIEQVTQQVLETVTGPQQQIHKIAAEGIAKVQGVEPARFRAVIQGCPARDSLDELMLRMLQQLLETSGIQIDVISSKRLTGEIVSHVAELASPLICVASLGPGGLAQTRYLCKRLISQFPDLKILVCRVASDDNPEQVRERLMEAGAYGVAGTLLELRDLILPLLSVIAAA